MPNRIVTWVKAHQTETWLGAGGVGVAGIALWRKRQASAAAGALPPGTTYTPGLSQLTPTTDGTTSNGADVQSQINDALSGVEQQLATLTTAPAVSTPPDGMTAAIGSLTAAITGLSGLAPAPAAPRKPATYTFKPGDTVESVASRFGTTATGLLAANPRSGTNFAVAGHAITLPGAGTAAGGRPAIAYTPGKGRTVESIAQEFGVTTAQLQAANARSGVALNTPGHRITIPGVR